MAEKIREHIRIWLLDGGFTATSNMNPHPIKVLLVEGYPADARLLEEQMRQTDSGPYEVCHVERLQDARERLRTQSFDVLLCELALPDSSGLETLTHLQQEAQLIPLVIVTGINHESLAIEAVTRGIQDYLIKGQLDGRQIVRAIRNAIERHQRTAAALKESRRLLQTIMECVPVGIAITEGPDAHFRMLSRTAYELNGRPLPADATVDQSLEQRRIFGADGTTELTVSQLPIIRALKAGELVNNEETILLRPDGIRIPLLNNAAPIRDENGLIVGAILVYQNITDRKQAEAELHKSNQRLNLLAETASQLLQSDSPQQVMEALCQKIMSFLDCQVFFNFLVDDEQQRLRLNASGGVSEEQARQLEWLDFGVAVSGGVARDGCRIVAENIAETPDPRTELLKSFGLKAYACHPLIYHHHLLGTLSFGTRTRTRFTLDELSLMKAVADQVAIVMERRRAKEVLQKAYDELEWRVSERTAELRQANRILRLISECKHALAHVANEGQLLQTFCRIITESGGFRMAWVGWAEHDVTKTIRPVAWAGLEDGFLTVTRHAWDDSPFGHGPTGDAIRSRSICQADNFMTAPMLAPWRDQALARGYHSCLAVPLMSGGEPLGVLTVYAGRSGTIHPGDTELLRDMANDLAFGIRALRAHSERDHALRELEQKASQLRNLASELTHAEQRERRRIAQFLHEHLQQLLAGAKFNLEVLRRPKIPGGIKRIVQSLSNTLNEALDSCRSMTYELSPPILYDAGLAVVLNFLGQWMYKRFGLLVHVHAGNQDLPYNENVSVLLYQAARELLFNVVKHADVRTARMDLALLPTNQVQLIVTDKGKGFDQVMLKKSKHMTSGFGLFNLRERLELMGGQLEIQSRTGHGSRLILTLPLQPTNEACNIGRLPDIKPPYKRPRHKTDARKRPTPKKPS